MRCFFNLVHELETILDQVGVEVHDLDSATLMAMRAIAELRQESDGDIEDWSGWRLDIVCEQGSILRSIDLEANIH